MIYTIGLEYLKFEEITIDEAITKLSKLKLISLDTETSGLNPWSDELLLLALGNSNFQIVINCRNCEGKEAVNSIKDKKIILHNSKFDIRFIKVKYNILLRNVYCTMLASQILYNGYKIKNDLSSVCKRFLGLILDKEIRKSFQNKPVDALFTKNEVEYAARDISVLEPLWTAQKHYISQYKMSYLIDLENKITPVIAKIELKGIDLDTQKWLLILNENLDRQDQLILKMDEEIELLSLKFKGLLKYVTKQRISQESVQLDIFGTGKKTTLRNIGNINYNSHAQVRDVFLKAGESIDSTSEDALKLFRRRNKSRLLRFVGFLLEYREIGTEINVFGEKFLKYINSYTGRIHTSFNQLTSSGRFSSGDEKDDEGKKSFSYVNFQNIPQKEKFRSCFIAPEGYSFLTLDYVGQEICISASDSQDELLLKSQNEGIDIHSLLAKESFKIIHNREEEISKTKNKSFRNIHKNLTFAIFYGAGYGQARDLLDIPESVAKRVHSNILSMLPKFTARMKYLGNFAKEKEYITNNKITNRRRWFKDYVDNEVYKLQKDAANFPIQSTGSDIVKESLVKIDEYLRDKDAWICNTVHDEICVIYGNKLEELPNVIKNIMEECADKYLTGVKMTVDIKIGKTWLK